MKAKLYDKSGKEKGSIDLPKNFSSRIREDILSKVYESEKLSYTQSYGIMKGAGSGYSASGIVRHKRHAWKTAYGKGISRVPRKIMSRNGSSFNWVGATVSSARGGRNPHGPKSEKVLIKKINKKELLIAFNSGLSGTFDSKFLEKKYNIKIPTCIVFSTDITELKTKELFNTLKIVFKEAFEKVLQKKKIRAGKGKLRGRKYKQNAGLLFVISSKEKMKQSGISVISVKDLTIKDLSPNGEPGRIACYTENAIKEIGERFK
jgi:large subunit ribosomal protein L4e